MLNLLCTLDYKQTYILEYAVIMNQLLYQTLVNDRTREQYGRTPYKSTVRVRP